MLTPLDRLRALHAAATPGPWDVTHNTLHEESRVYAGAHLRAFLDGRVLLGQREDADSIAANHNALPALLACVDALRSLCDAPRQRLDDGAAVGAARILVSHAQMKAIEDALAPLVKEEP